MRPLTTDVSIYGTFDFERPPVGIKFLFKRPEGIEQLVLGIDSDIYPLSLDTDYDPEPSGNGMGSSRIHR
jgi:hypothetical protein